MVCLLPVFAAVELNVSLWERLPLFRERARWYLEHRARTKHHLYYLPSSNQPGLISLVEKSRFNAFWLVCSTRASFFRLTD
jgi:hypothetical protein